MGGLLFGSVLVVLVFLRMLVRLRDGIRGSPLGDLIVAVFCTCCGMCQLARHEGLVAGRYGGLLSPTGEKRGKVKPFPEFSWSIADAPAV